MVGSLCVLSHWCVCVAMRIPLGMLASLHSLRAWSNQGMSGCACMSTSGEVCKSPLNCAAVVAEGGALAALCRINCANLMRELFKGCSLYESRKSKLDTG